MAERPRIAVCLAPADLRPDVDPLTGAVRSDPRRCDLTASDGAALEYGLRAADAWGGSVLAISAGPPEIDPALMEARALGAEVLRVEWPGLKLPGGGCPGGTAGGGLAAEDLADPAGVAAALAAGIGRADLVICGDRSASRGVGAVPGFLAHHLRASQALGAVTVTFDRPGVVLAERRLDGGWKERLRLEAPAVISVEAAGVRPRRAPLPAALEAAAASVPSVHPAGVGSASVAGPGDPVVQVGRPRPYRPRTRVVPAPAGATRDRLLALTGALTTREPPRIVGPVDAGPAADELLGYLERHGYR